MPRSKKIMLGETDLSVFVFKEGKYYISRCPALDLVSQGKTYEEALKAIREVVDIFFEETTKRGTLDKALEELGWQKERSHWVAPLFVGQTNIRTLAHA